ncbi:MAG: YolD-like family protein [Faecalimonas sp.]
MEHRGRMNREDRAKQFMPFAALKGYPEALRKKEKIVVPKIELPEEYQEELDRKLRQIKKNDVVTAVFFFKGEYLQKKRDGVPNRYIRQSDTDRQYENLY